jgi:hypothetical protein
MAQRKFAVPVTKEMLILSTTTQELPTDYPCQVYPRVSTPEQRENVSAEMQQDRKFAVLCGWPDDDSMIIVETDDLGLSGQLRMEDRPTFAQMLRNIASGKVRAIIVANISRFFRRKWNDEAEKFMQICATYGVKIIVPTPGRTAIKFIYDFSIKEHIAQFRRECEEAWSYLENHVYGTMLAAKTELGKMGRWEGANLPPGYIPDRREKIDGQRNPDYRLFKIYQPWVEPINWLFDRFWELGGHPKGLLKEISRREYVFPAFEKWVDKEIVAKCHLAKVLDEDGEIKGYTIKTESGLKQLLSNPVYIGYWIYKGVLLCSEDGEPIINHDPIVNFTKFAYAYNRISVTKLDGTVNEEVLERRNKYLKQCLGDKPAILQNCIEPSDPGFRINVCPIDVEKDHERVRTAFYYSFFKRREGIERQPKYMIPILDLDSIFLGHLVERLANTDNFDNFLDKDDAEREAQIQLEKDIDRDIHAEQLILTRIEKQIETGELADTPKLLHKAKESYKMHSAELERLQSRKEKLIKDTSAASKRRTYKQLMHEAGEYMRQGRIYELIPIEDMSSFISTFVRKVVVQPLAPHFYSLDIHWYDPEWGVDTLLCYRDGNPSTRWTPEEIAIVKQHYCTASRLELLQLLPGRNYVSISWQAKQLGMEPRPRELTSLPKSFCLQDWRIMEEYNLQEDELRAKKGGRLINWV